MEAAVVQAEREVWDVLNAGPLQRFTANGRLVHNCLILDHSGNCARFWDEWNTFFEVGCDVLDDGKKKEKKKPEKKKEAEMMKCSACGHLHRAAPFCPACGNEYPKRAAVEHVPGSLKELIATGDSAMMRKQLWPQIVGYVQDTLRDRGYDAAQKKAQAIYRELTGGFAMGRVDNTTPIPPTREVVNKIKANTIRWAKARQKPRFPPGMEIRA